LGDGGNRNGVDARHGSCGGWTTVTGVTAGHGRPALTAGRTSNVKGLWNRQLEAWRKRLLERYIDPLT